MSRWLQTVIGLSALSAVLLLYCFSYKIGEMQARPPMVVVKTYKVELHVPGTNILRTWKTVGPVVTSNNGVSWTFTTAGNVHVSISGSGVLVVTEILE